MGLVVRGNGRDRVLSKSGRGFKCKVPMMTSTAQCSPNVRANGIGIVRTGDRVRLHPRAGCSPDISIAIGRTRVLVNGRNAVKIGDKYTSDNIIIGGSSNVIF